GIAEPVLNVSVQRRHKAVPQAALSEDKEADSVDLVHHLNNSGKERLRDAMAVVGPSRQQQVFKLIERNYNWDLETPKDFHQSLEQVQDQVLTCGPNVELQFREAIRQEAGQFRLVAEQDSTGKALMHVPAHQARRAVRCRLLDVLAHDLACLLHIQPRFLTCPADGAPLLCGKRSLTQTVEKPLHSFLGLRAAQSELSCPAAESGRWEKFQSFRRT